MACELTKTLVDDFHLNYDQQKAIKAINFLSDLDYATVDDVYLIYAQLMSEGTGRTWTSDEAKEWLDDKAKVDQNLLSLIGYIRQQGVLVVISSNAASNHLQNLINMGMLNHFVEIYVSSLIGHTKPSRSFFEFILDKHRVKPTEALFIDDNQENVESARLAGLHGQRYEIFGDTQRALTILKWYHLL